MGPRRQAKYTTAAFGAVNRHGMKPDLGSKGQAAERLLVG